MKNKTQANFDKPDSWFNKLIGYKLPSFLNTKFVKVCHDCAKLPQEYAINCDHRSGDPPPFSGN